MEVKAEESAPVCASYSSMPTPAPVLGKPPHWSAGQGTLTCDSCSGFPSGEEDDEFSLCSRNPADLLSRKPIPSWTLGESLQVVGVMGRGGTSRPLRKALISELSFVCCKHLVSGSFSAALRQAEDYGVTGSAP